MSESVINQIKPKNSLEILATCKLKYFWTHNVHSTLHGERTDVRTDRYL